MTPINPGPVFSFGVPVTLFSVEPFQAPNPTIGYDVHPDGKRFLMLRPVGSGTRRDELILAESFTAELSGRAKPR